MQIDRHFYRKLGIFLVILIVCPILIWGIRVFTTVNNLKTNLDDIRNFATVDNPLDIDPDEITGIISSSRNNVLSLERDTAFLLKYTPLVSWLPKVGDLISELPDLLRIADIGTRIASELWTIAQPTYIKLQDQGFNIEVINEFISTFSSNIQAFQKDAYELIVVYEAIDPEVIPWRYRELFKQAGPLLSIYYNGLALIDDVPQIIGVNKPITYLVLALNEDELRPGGGFISGVGELVLRDGKISSMEFGDSYSADDFTLPYPDAPSPFTQFMAIDLWVFRDSNWSPDFPSSAKQAISLYRPPEAVIPIGVLALDQFATGGIVDVVGPLHIPGSDSAVTGDTLIEYIHNAWAPDNPESDEQWWWDRKSFMGDITRAALQKVENGAVDWTSLLQTAIQLIEERHIQIYINNEDAKHFLSSQGWDSRLILPEQDSLFFVESNVGYNKVSTRIDRTLSYSVDLTVSPPKAEVKLSLQHLSQNNTDCTPEVRFYPTYVESMERCYWAYFRFYVPEGSRLIEASQHPIDAEYILTGIPWPGIVNITRADEGPGTVFEQALLLPTGSTSDMVLRYNLPEQTVLSTDTNEYIYRLTLQKQAGLRTIPVQVKLRLPQNALISTVHPDAHRVESGVLMYDVNLHKNIEFELRYTLSGKE